MSRPPSIACKTGRRRGMGIKRWQLSRLYTSFMHPCVHSPDAIIHISHPNFTRHCTHTIQTHWLFHAWSHGSTTASVRFRLPLRGYWTQNSTCNQNRRCRGLHWFTALEVTLILIAYHWTCLLIMDHSYLVGNLTYSKIAETKPLESLKSWHFCISNFRTCYLMITYYWTVSLILDQSHLVGKSTSSKIAGTKGSGF